MDLVDFQLRNVSNKTHVKGMTTLYGREVANFEADEELRIVEVLSTPITPFGVVVECIRNAIIFFIFS